MFCDFSSLFLRSFSPFRRFDFLLGSMATRRRETWSTADSQQEMQKWVQSTSNDSQIDPVVRETQEALSENMWFFLDNIAERCVRYDAAMKNVAALNPNNTMSMEELRHATDINETPFLKIRLRRFVDVAVEDANEENASAPEQLGKCEAHQVAEATGSDVAVVGKENEEDDEEDDDDDDDTYDAVDEIPVAFPRCTELMDQMKHLKLAGTELVTVFEGICDWLQLSIPDIMIDDNDSVDVMRSVLEATSAHREAVDSTIVFLREFLDDRADLEIETLKFPHSISLRRQMLINDLDAWSEVERGWRTLVRCSLIIHTLLAKNMRKLLNPRNSSRSSALYQ